MLLSYYGEKRNTDELLKCYGERNVVDAISLRHFVSEAGKEALSFVDALLNVSIPVNARINTLFCIYKG